MVRRARHNVNTKYETVKPMSYISGGTAISVNDSAHVERSDMAAAVTFSIVRSFAKKAVYG